MIQHVLPVVVDELNEYLKSQFNAVEDKAILSAIVEQDGSLALESGNKIVATLIFVDKDVTYKSGPGTTSSGLEILQYSPPLNINLTVMFSALFSRNHYIESLRYLSGVIYFFQYKPLFTRQNTPKLSRGADKIYFDLLSVSPSDMMNYYSMLGIKYVPSVVYKVRMLTFSQDNVVADLPAIRGLETK
ncbi:DUF4255 domain-containing protein [Dawidia soli]|uniref:DUF4255 domain-containing protein n=1 Tax=Dawidia soli TaxID=2782352 RepID=A0AAP2D867_9BACT|nr:DUF4255 domain-containing protein [Dawidia soli]MBT1686939.1 DUF4255 domain-containing protein [Dawidia soli]